MNRIRGLVVCGKREESRNSVNKFQPIAGLGIQAGAEAAHELLVSGLLIVAAREDDDCEAPRRDGQHDVSKL